MRFCARFTETHACLGMLIVLMIIPNVHSQSLQFLPLEFDTLKMNYVNSGIGYSHVLTYNYDPELDKDWAIYVCAYSKDSTLNNPLIVSARRSISVISWTVPEKYSKFGVVHNKVCHTLCPLSNYIDRNVTTGKVSLYVDIMTFSPVSLEYSLEVSKLTNFVLSRNESHVLFNVTTSTPQVVQYDMADDVNSVIVEARSKTRYCALLSLQSTACPIFDSERTVEFEGFYQTMTLKAAITVTRDKFPDGKFYIVMVLKPIDDCNKPEENELPHELRIKDVELFITPPISNGVYYGMTALVVSIYGGFILICGIVCYFKGGLDTDKLDERVTALAAASVGEFDSTIETWSSYCKRLQLFFETNSIKNPVRQRAIFAKAVGVTTISVMRNLLAPAFTTDRTLPQLMELLARHFEQQESDFAESNEFNNRMCHNEHKSFMRVQSDKAPAKVSDVTTIDGRYLYYRSMVYCWNELGIGIIFWIPAIQFVLMNLKIISEMGDQDKCFYNFLCAHRAGIFVDAGGIISNIGYIVLGLFFLVIVCLRERSIKKFYKKQYDTDIFLYKTECFPLQFGILKALAIALIAEGIYSATYHICPNNVNFQFDTAFMYVICVMCIVFLYQSRRPDLVLKPYQVLLLIAFLFALSALGEIYLSGNYWIAYGIVQFFGILAFVSPLYAVHKDNLDKTGCCSLCSNCSDACQPVETGTPCCPCCCYIWVFLGNLGICLYQVIEQPEHFCFQLLLVLLVNLILYLIYHLLRREKCGAPVFYFSVCFILWVASVVVFLGFKRADSELRPALSREKNAYCLFGIYDHHDLWHILSSFALFFTYLTLLTLDDCLVATASATIPIF